MSRDVKPPRQTQQYLSTPTPDKTRVWEPVGVESDETDRNHIRFKIMTYNVLSQSLLETNSHLFERCDPSHLIWETRFSRLLKHISQESPDILCLQEIEAKHFHAYNERLEESGFNGYFFKKTGVTSVDGCATYIKQGVFEFAGRYYVKFFQPKVSVMQHNQIGIIVKLRPCSMPNSLLVVANTHLLSHPKKAVVRLAQLRLFLAEIDRLSYEFNGTNFGHLPIILTGDFNSHPDSTVIKFLGEGQIEKYEDWDDKHWKNIGITDNSQFLTVYVDRENRLYRGNKVPELGINNSDCYNPSQLQTDMYIDMFTSTILSHSLHFQSVYDTQSRKRQHSRTCNHDVESCRCMPRAYVDYMFYNARTGLRPLERLRLAAFNQLPNEFSGSDHQSLVVVFELNAEQPY